MIGGAVAGGAVAGGAVAGGARRQVVVTGVGLICPLADSLAGLGQALADGESGLAPVDGFDIEGLPCRLAGEIHGLDPTRYLRRGNLRPLDRTARLAAIAAHLALADSGWLDDQGAGGTAGRPLLGLALGTMFGSVHTISAFDRRAQEAGPQYAKPMDFANSVINAAAGQLAIWHGLAGINSTLAGGPTAGLTALAYAVDLIAIGRIDAMLAGGADELCEESFRGFARAGRACHVGDEGERPVPFDTRRNGFAPAEGAALLMLEEETAARRRGARILAHIGGHGAAFDPSRGADETAAASAVARAITAALTEAGLDAVELDAVSAGANGSIASDRHEAAGLAAALGDSAATLPITAIKSMLGEALGASGALQAAAMIDHLEHGRLPGIANLEAADPALTLVWHNAARQLPLRHSLVTCPPYDGATCALVLCRGECTATSS